jgi:hypothetical protein
MDWSILLAALVGGLIGALISAAMTGFGWRREARQGRRARRWEDAQVVADVRLFLGEISPLGRVASVSTVETADGPALVDENSGWVRPQQLLDAERTRWVRLQQQCDDMQRLLLVIAAGHPSEAVQSSARKLATEVLMATLLTKLHVGDVLRHQVDAVIQDQAYEAHKIALATADELEEAVKKAGGGS